MRRRPLRTALIVTAYALAAALFVAFIVMISSTLDLVSAVRASQLDNKPTIDAAARAAKAAEKGTDRIEDCTTPGRDCYDDGQKRTAQVVGDLNRVIVLAAYCADRPGDQTVVEIQACVIAKLAAQDKSTR